MIIFFVGIVSCSVKIGSKLGFDLGFELILKFNFVNANNFKNRSKGEILFYAAFSFH